MSNIKDYPELVNPSDGDWVLIQENNSIPAYKKAQLVNIRGVSGSGSGSSSLWIYRDGTTDFSISTGGSYLIDTPQDVTITIGSLADGSEIEIQRISENNSIFLVGISKIQGVVIDINSSVRVLFNDTPSKLIYINSAFGWFFTPTTSVLVLNSLNIPTTGLVQLFNAANITANNGDKIGVWLDEVSSKDAIQTDINSQAIYTESIFTQGTVGGVFFSGYEEYETDLSYLVGEKYTIAIVEARNSNNRAYVIGSDDSGTNEALHVGYRYGEGFTIAQYGNDLDASISSYDGLITPVLWVVSNNSRGKEIFRNGILIQSSSNTDDLNRANFGRIGSALGSTYEGYLGLIATWTGDKSTAEIADINNAINSSFGVYQ